MVGVSFKDQTNILGKPSSMTDDECYGLPVKFTNNGRFQSTESVWELTDEEIAHVIKTKRVRLGILGHGMPPVYMQVEQIELNGSPELTGFDNSQNNEGNKIINVN